jgi:hypothetical protein
MRLISIKFKTDLLFTQLYWRDMMWRSVGVLLQLVVIIVFSFYSTYIKLCSLLITDFAVSNLQTVKSIDKNHKIFEVIIYKKLSTLSYTH